MLLLQIVTAETNKPFRVYQSQEKDPPDTIEVNKLN